jgi:hypothetical protein
MPHLSYPWHVWPGRHWPASREDEAALIAELSSAEPVAGHFERGDVTAVLNALRCGVNLDILKRHTPGIRPGRLVAGYLDLQARLERARTAWDAIVAEPHISTVTHHGPDAIAVLPGIEDPLFKARVVMGPDHLPEEIARLAEQVSQRTVVAHRLEDRLEQYAEAGRDDDAVRAGRDLYDPYVPGAWGHPLFLPDRVGTLMPVRVSDLLNERRR